MGFLDELKENAGKALEKAKSVGEKAVEKGKDLAQQGKLGVEVITLENKIKDLKVNLATKAIENNLFKENEEISSIISEIKELNNQIMSKKNDIEQLK